MSNNFPTRFAYCTTALLTTFAAGACAKDDSDAATAEDYDSVARSMGPTVADSSGGETMAMSDVADMTLGDLPLGFSLAASGHVTGTLFGITYDYLIECSNAAGDPLLTCGADTTASAAASFSWNGNLALPNLGVSVERTGDWTIEELQTDVATFNGASTFSYDGTITVDNIERAYALDVSATYRDVKITTATRAVQSGAASYRISAERSVDDVVQASFDMDAELTFENEDSATLVLDGDHEYSVDIHTGAVVKL